VKFLMRVTTLSPLWFALPLVGCAQTKPMMTQDAVPALVQEAVKYQLEDYRHSAWGLSYRVHRTDDKEDSERLLIESADGNVARTLMRHGKPLTADEDAAERKRLEGLSVAEVTRKRKQADSSAKYGVELMSALPKAMLFTLAQGQPQLPQIMGAQVVLDFVPNPQYHPGTTAQSALPCIAGRVWIDAETHHVLRIEIKVIKNLNVMLGFLARVYEGGTFSYQQHAVGGGHYAYDHMQMNVKLRELMVKTVPYNATYTATDVKYLPVAPSLQDAVKMLLAVPSPLR
jgi:hypothetical protein